MSPFPEDLRYDPMFHFSFYMIAPHPSFAFASFAFFLQEVKYMYTDITKLLPDNVEVSLFFVFDGDGRLSIRTFTKERALNRIKKGLVRQVGPNAVQHKAVFNDESVTFYPDITFPYDVIVLTDPLSGRHADETTRLIEIHNVEAVRNSPLYEIFPEPQDNGIPNHYPSSRVDPLPKKPFGPMSKYQINKNAVRRWMRRVKKKRGAVRNTVHSD